MAKPQKSTAQSEVPGLVKKGPLYYLKRDWQLYALMLLPMVFIIVFKYFAYTGLSVAFLDYKIGKGYAGSKFVGLKIFEKVFKHRDFTKAVVNTLLLNVLDLIFSFPMPIILALLLNEIRVKWFKRTTQTLLYLPHFLSWVVIGAVAYQMFATQSGVVNALIANAGKSPIPFLQEDGWWLFSYVLIGVWQTMGWGTIIYLAAITNVNSELYEAAKVDGANRWQQCLHVTLPCIRSTIVVMLIMQLGKLMGGSFERIVALSNAKATEFTTTIPVLVYKWFQGKRINNPNTHGTGCTLSSAIASNLAKGFDLDTSVERAKKYISGALAAMLDLGKGSGPMDHGFAIKNEFTLSHDEITAEAADKEAK